MPILIAPINQMLTIKRVSGSDKERKHLESLGIVPGRNLTVLKATSNGVIVMIDEMRLAIDRNVAMSIVVAA
jgi:ferrous iron transport protein A